MKLVLSSAMAKIDKRSQEEYHFPALLLMENAGLKAYQFFKEKIWEEGREGGELVFVAGKGNNGGDVLVMARQCFVDFSRGKEDGPKVSVLLLSRQLSGNVAIQQQMCETLGIAVYLWDQDKNSVMEKLTKADYIFDGITGTGLKGELRGKALELTVQINSCPGRVIAVDVPSGLGDTYKDGYPGIKADFTLTIGLPKLCLYSLSARKLCGQIIRIPLGFPPDLISDDSIPGDLLEDADIVLPAIPRHAYKNSRGHLAVFAGTTGTMGAAFLAAESAARGGAGLVTLFVEQKLYPHSLTASPSVIIQPWNYEAPFTNWDVRAYNALLVGPGWGQGEERAVLLKTLVESGLPGVVDADGINCLSHFIQGKLLGSDFQTTLDFKGRWVLTPHPGEFCRISRIEKQVLMDNPVPYVLALSSRLNAVVVLKSYVSFVGCPGGKYYVLDGSSPFMGTAGSGDVLAGLIAGLLASGLPEEEAAKNGILIHLKLGRQLFKKQGWFIAEDLLLSISAILKEHRAVANE